MLEAELVASLEQDYVPTLEELLEEDFANFTLMPLQRAVCRIADGRPLGDLANHPHVVAAIGKMRGARGVPKTMALLCAIRAAKSLIAAAAGVRCALTCDVSGLAPGDIPRVSIISLRRDTADVIFTHILGAIRNSARVRSRVIGEPNAGKLLLRHPSGRSVEIVVDAGKRAGGSLVARWMAAVIFDEAPRMVGADEGVVNVDDSRAAVAGRLLPCACSSEWLIGSPWAPFGPMFEIARDTWQKSSREMVVVRARGDWMNPVWWTPARIESFKSNAAYKSDFLAEFADAESSLLSGDELEACTRKEPLVLPSEVDDGYEYVAEMDPATRVNAWTLIVAKMTGKKHVIVLAKQWVPTRDGELSPAKILTEIRDVLAPYRVTRIGTDQWRADSLREIAKERGLALIDYTATRENKNEGYLELATKVRTGVVEFPNDPVLIADLRRLKRVTTANGFKIDEPSTGDGRHCDYAPAVRRAVQRVPRQPKPVDELTGAQRDQARYLAKAQERVRKKGKPWYAR